VSRDTDNCCNEVGQLVDHFPWLRGEYMNLKMPSLTFCGQTHVVTTEDGCRAACELFEKASVVGFDMEWWFATTSAGKQRPTALVQLATEDHAVLIQLSEFMSDSSSLPPALLQLMRSESVKKAGVGIDGDIKKLTRDFPSSKLFETASGIIDLSRLANERIIGPRCSRWGLASLCNAVLQKDLPKVQAIRLSNWEASPLSSQQVEYAALDAYAGVALYRKLIGPSPPLTEVGLMPTIDENDVSGDLDSVLDYDYDDVVAEREFEEIDDGLMPARAHSVEERLERAAAVADDGLEKSFGRSGDAWLKRPPVPRWRLPETTRRRRR